MPLIITDSNVEKLKESMSETKKGLNSSENEMDKILDTYITFEMFRAANDFEQNRYESANDLLLQCSRTGIVETC